MKKPFIGDYKQEDTSFNKYDILSSPNDFNIQTIFNLMDSKVIEIPGFQRNYIWDIKRASKLIESFIIGLPVPQIFLYEKSKNKFLVIDGQQRLMTIYYFIKQRFPKKSKRAELRKIFVENGKIPDEILADDEYFEKFNLALPELSNKKKNPLNTRNYASLTEEYRPSFDLRTMRSIILKQLEPDDGDSSIYEIFSRLNTGGMNLYPQEIRASLYHSDFYRALEKMNNFDGWRNIYGKRIHPRMKDVEIILRGFAFLTYYDNYKTSLSRFLNEFSKTAVDYNPEKVEYLKKLFGSFLEKTKNLRENIFFSNGRFNILIYEAVFCVACKKAYKEGSLEIVKLKDEMIEKIRDSKKFSEASAEGTGRKYNIDRRLKVVEEIFNSGGT
jgi:uncharacterized protein with ParB-like and HNH nuclease domain